MSAHIYSGEISDDENEAETFETDFGGRESVVFAIECCEEMFEKIDDESYFERIIVAIHEMLLNKIITSDKDMHGIIFFGVDKSADGKFAGLKIWQDFDVPCVKGITELREIQNIDFRDFQLKFGSKSDYDVSNVLWASHQMFTDCSFKLANKTLVVFPWNDRPHFGDTNAIRRAKSKCTDMHDHNEEIQVFSFNPDFEYDKFYKDLVTDPDLCEESTINPISGITNLYGFLLRKCYKQRMTRTRLQLGDFKISVGLYTVARRATKSAAVWIDSSTNKIAKRQMNLVDTNTGEMLMPSDVKLYQTWAGRDIVFEKGEVASMRNLCDVGLNLIGFQPRGITIKPWYHVKPAQFMYPDDNDLKGSSTFFIALLQKCLEKDLVAICRFTPRASSPPRNVALLPHNGSESTPHGFYIIYLPFSDDIRDVETPRHQTQATESQVAAAEAMIRKLRFKYDPDNFDNPAIQTHYKNLEAMAIGKAQPDPVIDHTIPDFERIEKKAGALIENFKELVFPPDYDPNKQPTKHKADSTTRESKRSKTEGTEVNIKEAVENRTLGKFTVLQLKEICKELGVKISGKKADIITSIMDYYI